MSAFRLLLKVLPCVLLFLVFAEKEAAGGARKGSCMAKWLILSGIKKSSVNIYERSLQTIRMDESNYHHPLRKPVLPFLFHHHPSDAKKFILCFEKRTLKCRRAPSCGASGKCLLGKKGYHCKCQMGWTGNFCDTELDGCKSNPCQHGAQCTDSLGHYQCSCQPGFEGRRCEKRWLNRGLFKAFRQQLANLTSTVNNIEKGMKTQAVAITKLNESMRILQLGSLSCAAIYKSNFIHSGRHFLQFSNGKAKQVWCDMMTDGGGWTVIQRRKDGSVKFFRNWNDYKNGFGDVSGEFWLGNEWIHRLTSGGRHELRIDFNGGKYAKYSQVTVASEGDQYRLRVSGFSGNIGDGLLGHNQPFTTKDRDNDHWKGNCAVAFPGAWWYNACHHSNLNGIYGRKDSRGIFWRFPVTYPTFVEMKIR